MGRYEKKDFIFDNGYVIVASLFLWKEKSTE